MFVYAGFTAVAEKLDEIIERLPPPRQPRAHSRRNWSLVTAIRTAFEQRGELSAVIELRRLFPGIADADQARQWVRIISSWRPLVKQKSACSSGTRVATRR